MFNTDFFNRGIAGAMAHEATQSTLEKAATAQAVADSQARVAHTQMVPKLFSRDTAFSPALLKSALFRCTERGARATYASLPLESADGDTITYSGEELRQDDQAVLLALIKLASGELVTAELQFSPRAFVRDTLQWPDKGSSVDRLAECLMRLKGAQVKVRYAQGGEGTLSFVSDYDIKRGGWSVWLAPRLLGLFAKQTTYLNEGYRFGLTGLNSWLFGFINADSCAGSFELAALRTWAGSASEQKHFNEQLRQALKVLKVYRIVQSYEITRTHLKVVKAPR